MTILLMIGACGQAGAATPGSLRPSGGVQSPLTLTYVANMGVLVSAADTKVLIDALFDKPNPEYRAPTPVWHEGDPNGRCEIFEVFGLKYARLDLAVIHFWYPLEPNCARFLQEDLKAGHIALSHLPIRLEGDAPGKIDMVRQFYQDLTLLLPGIPAKVYQAEATPRPGVSLGQTPPGLEPVKFWPDVLAAERCPHGQLVFSPDGTGVFWSAILPPGPEQTIYFR